MKATKDEHLQLLDSLEVHWAKLLAKPLSDEELEAEALKEAQQLLDSQVDDIDK